MTTVSTPSNLQIIDSIVQFVNGGASDWASLNLPVPAKTVIYASDTKDVKIGDGTSLYAALPVAFNLNDILTIMSTLTSQAQQINTVIAQVQGVATPKRFIFEGIVQADGLSIALPWTVSNLAALDVSIPGIGPILNSTISINNGNTLVLDEAQNPNTVVRIVWNTMLSGTTTITDELGTLLTYQQWINAGGGGSTGGGGGTGGGGTTTNPYGLPDGDTIFNSELPNIWLTSGSGVPSGDTIFQSLQASSFLPSGNGTLDGTTIFISEGPSIWVANTSTITYDNIFQSIGVGSFLTSGSSVPDADTVFDSRDATDFAASGSGVQAADTVFNSVGAATWS
ncbi:unnamed protein product [Sphagnum balticum]